MDFKFSLKTPPLVSENYSRGSSGKSYVDFSWNSAKDAITCHYLSILTLVSREYFKIFMEASSKKK